MFDELYLSLSQVVCFDGDGDGAGGDGAGGDGAGGAGADKTFTETDVNRIVQERLARDRKAREADNQELAKKYEELLQNQSLSQEERNRLEENLEDVKKRFRAKETEAATELKQLREEFETKLAEKDQQAQRWEALFRQSTVDRSLQDAAVANDAYSPSQVVSLLRPMTKLVEDLSADGKPTGQWKTMIDFPDVDDKGESFVAQRSPEETVKRMKELGEYANLFKANVVSGVGANSATGGMSPGSGGRLTPQQIKKLPAEQYAKLRKENPELLGLRAKKA